MRTSVVLCPECQTDERTDRPTYAIHKDNVHIDIHTSIGLHTYIHKKICNVQYKYYTTVIIIVYNTPYKVQIAQKYRYIGTVYRQIDRQIGKQAGRQTKQSCLQAIVLEFLDIVDLCLIQ